MKCPICGKEFNEHPAISRRDNKTEICPKCGTREAIEDYGKAQGMTCEEMREMCQRIAEETAKKI